MENFSRFALAIHTSSPDLGLAISNFAESHRQQVWHLGREQSNLLHAYLEEFLQPQTWSDLTFLAVAIGPGGFTGTRIGVVLARTIAQQLEIPLFGVSSLAAIAYQQGEGIFAVQMPAQRGELHTGIYQRTATGLTALQPDTVLTPEAWQEVLHQQNGVLTSVATSAYTLVKANAAQGEYATSLLELACLQWQAGQRPHWSEVLPFYGQHPVLR